MNKKSETVCCSLEKGEIFPGAVLNEKFSTRDQSYKALKAKYIRSCHQEMLDNYNCSH